MEHREAPGIGPEPTDEGRPRPGRRFARLVESPAARRVALPRLLLAGGLLLLVVALGVVGVSKLAGRVAAWVAARPEHQVRFDAIELVPEPDPWVLGGRSKILEEVRARTSFGPSILLLDLDLAKLEQDFSLCAWVKKVIRVDRSRFGRLIVELSYRKPVAVVPFESVAPGAFVLDEEAVVLPDRDIDWTSNRSPFRVRGVAAPLIEIRRLPESTPVPKVGLPWKGKAEEGSNGEPDPMVLRACRLARFLQVKQAGPDRPPVFSEIYLPDTPDGSFFLRDSEKNWVCWGKAPGDERAGEPSSEARWAMLREWIKAQGPLSTKGSDSLYFTNEGAKLYRGWRK